MPAYCATPSVAPPWPGVVVVHDFTGMSCDLRAQADWLASEGYVAVAPDLYHWGSRLRCLRTIMRDIGQRRGRTFDDLDAARRWLLDEDDRVRDASGWWASAWAAGTPWRWPRTGGSPPPASTTADARRTRGPGCPGPARSSAASAAPIAHLWAGEPASGSMRCWRR